MTFATIKDVAQQAGVSVPTVSQVLNETGRISTATRNKVLATIRELNYIPNSAAQSIRSSSSKTIGVLVPDIRNSYFAYLIAAITKQLSKNGYVCLIGSSSESLEGQDRFLRSLLSQRIDGAIIVPQGKISPGLRRFLETDLPVVFLDRSVEDVDPHHIIPLIDANPYPGTRTAIQTAIGLGHKVIGFVHGPVRKSPNLKERQMAFSQIGSQLLGVDKTIVAQSTGAISAIKELLNAGADTMMFGYSPDALAGIRYFHDAHLRIGKDISIISYDDIPIFELFNPAISVISQQVDLMGISGAKRILTMLSAPDSSIPSITTNTRIPTQFISRQSVSQLQPDSSCATPL